MTSKSYSILSVLLAIISVASLCAAEFSNPAPVFGILSQPCPRGLNTCRSHYINADYVKWLESGGGKALVISHRSSVNELRSIFGKINGIVFPGGNTNLRDGYFRRAAETLYSLAVKSNEAGIPFPIWGTCLGFEMLAVIAGSDNVLTRFNAYDIPLTLQFTEGADDAQMWQGLSATGKSELMTYLATVPATDNLHYYGISPRNFYGNSNLNGTFRVLATSLDKDGREFVALMEGKKLSNGHDLPFYATQFHPERNANELHVHENIERSYESVRAMNHWSSALVAKATENIAKGHNFSSMREYLDALIYNHQPIFAQSDDIENDLQFYVF